MKYLTICPKAVAVQWVLFQVKNSNHMEPEGLQRCLSKVIDDSDIDMHTLATDRHLMVGKLMKDHHPHVSKLLSSMLCKIMVIILYSYGWLNRVHPATLITKCCQLFTIIGYCVFLLAVPSMRAVYSSGIYYSSLTM